MSISVRNVSKLYGAQKALDDVSFDIGGGEVVGFLGPNGAGKSTMMKVLTCYIPQNTGEASVCRRLPPSDQPAKTIRCPSATI